MNKSVDEKWFRNIKKETACQYIDRMHLYGPSDNAIVYHNFSVKQYIFRLIFMCFL